jgi:hypothetical protein
MSTGQIGTIITLLNKLQLDSITSVVPSGSTFITYNTQYCIRVAALNTNNVPLDYGSVCCVLTPNPVINVATNQCNSSTPLASLNTWINATTGITNSTGYKWEVTNMLTSQVGTITTSLPKLQLTSITSIVPTSPTFLTNNTQYCIRVAALNTNNVPLNYGSVCCVLTPLLRESSNSFNENFNIITSPNPFNTNFTLNIESPSKEAVSIKVYDMLGKLVDDLTVDYLNSNNLTIGDNYTSGIYTILITQGENSESVRIVKQ